MATTAFNKERLFPPANRTEFEEETSDMLHLSTDLYGAEILTLRKILQKYLGSLEMWCWRRMEDISWIQRMKNEDVLQRVK